MLPGVVASQSRKRRRDVASLRFSWRSRRTTGSGRRAAHEHLASVEILHEHTDAFALAALGLVAKELDLGSDRQAGFRDAVPEEIARWAALIPI